MTGRASPALLTELWQALKDNLVTSLRASKVPSAELLGVVRRFLRDNGQLYAPDEGSRADLDRLRVLYRQRLLEALDQPKPPATVLAEARTYWTQHGPAAHASGPESPTDTPSAADLHNLALPFKGPQ